MAEKIYNTVVEFSENNSGGHWRLSEADLEALKAEGWTEGYSHRVLRKKGFRSLKAAVAEWEDITGKDPRILGCSCCGVPFNFSFENEDTKDWEYFDDYYPRDDY